MIKYCLIAIINSFPYASIIEDDKDGSLVVGKSVPEL